MSREHHTHSHEAGEGLRLGFLINTSFGIVEFIAGLFSNSLALVSDSIHNLTDSLSIVLSYSAHHIGKRRADHQKTFGYGRAAILAAVINATILLLTSFFIFYEAYQRFLHPAPVQGGIVILIALLGIVSNGAVAFVVSWNKRDLNSRAIFISNIMDVFSSIGALIAGTIILLTGQSWADPLISLLIGGVLLRAAWEIICEAADILLESVPKGIDSLEVREAILGRDEIQEIDDLHIWTMGAGERALSCHIVITDCSLTQSVKIVSLLKRMLFTEYQITHATIETHTECGPHDNERIDEGLSSLNS